MMASVINDFVAALPISDILGNLQRLKKYDCHRDISTCKLCDWNYNHCSNINAALHKLD